MSFIAGAIFAVMVGVATLGNWFAAAAAFVFATILVWLFQPVLAPDFAGLWVIMAFTLTLGGGVAVAMTVNRRYEATKAYIAAVVTASAGPVVLLALLLLAFLTTATVFHAQSYADLLGTVETRSFADAVQRLDTTGRVVGTDLTVIDQSKVRLVDETVAERRAAGLLGNDPEFGSSFTLGDMQLTRREGRIVYAAPLEYSGFRRWLSGTGTPGYVWVDAHDVREAGLVKELGGKPISMRCLPSAYWGDNIERLAWNHAPSTGLTDFSFEVGPDNRPIYAITTYAHRIGFGGDDPSGVMVVDPQTCVATRYDMAHIPAYVNRVVPASMATDQAEDWAEFRGGWWNASMGSGTGVLKPTPGIELVSTTATGDTAWYLGMSTPSNKNGTAGFLLVDSRTKKAIYFQQAGVTETSAQSAILGKISEKRGWSATLPILYNISDRATYLAILKDSAGNYKGIALLPVDDPNLIVVSDDLPRGLVAYNQLLAGHTDAGADTTGIKMTVDGKVARVASEVIDGNTVYYFTFAEHPGAVFTATNRLGPQVALTSPGDAVHVVAAGADQASMTVNKLDNPSALTPR